MNTRVMVVCAILVSAITGCGGGSGEAEPTEEWEKAKYQSAKQSSGEYESANQLRRAIATTGIDCFDEGWTPQTPPTIPSAESQGTCRSGVIVTVLPPGSDNLTMSNALADLSYVALQAALQDPEAKQPEYQYVQGSNWLVRTNDTADAASIQVTLGGENVTP